MDTLNDLLAASDLISLHCALTNETVQIINAECLQHIKPGTYVVIIFCPYSTFVIELSPALSFFKHGAICFCNA